jgi:fatty acid desaturase
MTTQAGPDRDLTIGRIPDPAEPVPAIAWPTLALAGAGLGLWSAAATLALTGTVPWWIATLTNAVAAFFLFTVTHESWHHSTSTNSTYNRWMGRVATAFFAPFSGFAMARFIHMQHHRFTNEPHGKDPDHFLEQGSPWSVVWRSQAVDYYYFKFYAQHWSSRPRSEQIELTASFSITTAIAVIAVAFGYGWEFLYLYILPSRIQLLWLGYAFAYLPHHDLSHTPQSNRFRTTRLRVGAERLLTPVMLYQNYHLVHHLHPLVPFYRYIAVWRRNEGRYLANDPAVVSVRGRPLSADEYQQLRELREHDGR